MFYCISKYRLRYSARSTRGIFSNVHFESLFLQGITSTRVRKARMGIDMGDLELKTPRVPRHWEPPRTLIDLPSRAPRGSYSELYRTSAELTQVAEKRHHFETRTHCSPQKGLSQEKLTRIKFIHCI